MNGKPILAGVIGNPIGQTKSPIMHNYWLQRYNINGYYIPIEVKGYDLRDVFKSLPKMGFKGVNVTIPFKIDAYDIMDMLSDRALKCGSVNTVTITENGKLYGDNTDCYGFVQNIEDNYPGFDFSKGKTIVLGAGGAARAVVASVVAKGCKDVIIAARTIENALEIVKSIKGNITVVGWDNRANVLKYDDINLLVNCTPLGMTGEDPLDLDLSCLTRDALVTDVVYNPLETDLLINAANNGNPTVDGIGMLVNQACPAFKAWFGVTPEFTVELRDILLG